MKSYNEDAVRKAAAGHQFLSNNPPEVVWNGVFTEGYDLEPGSDAETVLTRCHERVTGRKPGEYIATAYIDSRVFVLYGGMPCMVYGPICEDAHGFDERVNIRSEEHTSELQSLMRISYAVFCLKKKKRITRIKKTSNEHTTHTQIKYTST